MKKIYEDFTRLSLREMMSNGHSLDKDKEQIVTALASHPTLPLYISANVSGRLLLWHFGLPHALAEFGFVTDEQRRAGVAPPDRITRIRFSETGTTFAATSANGKLAIWTFQYKPYMSASHLQHSVECFEVHDRHAFDFDFIRGGHMFATAGDSVDGHNVALWDTLFSDPKDRMVFSFYCHEGGATSLAHVPDSHLLVTGGHKGSIMVFDLERMAFVHKLEDFKGGRISTLYYDRWNSLIYSGSAEGHVKVWDSQNLSLVHEVNVCQRQTFFNHPTAYSMYANFGVTDLLVFGRNVYLCASDGAVKLIRKKMQPFLLA